MLIAKPFATADLPYAIRTERIVVRTSGRRPPDALNDDLSVGAAGGQ